MRITLVALIASFFLLTPSAGAEVRWDIANSTFGNGDTPFTAFGDFGVAAGPVPAIGGSFSNPAGLLMGFVKTTDISGVPTIAQTDLTGTSLPAGEIVKLRFTKLADDKVKFVGLLADPNQPIVFTALSSTSFMITARIADPVESASGNAGAAFGMLIVTEELAPDFGGTIFATDLHWLDIEIPSIDTDGVFSISGNGKQGVAATTTAIIPIDKLSEFGLTEDTAGDVRGYIDGVAVPEGSFVNQGVSSPAGFEFLNPQNPENKVLIASIINSSWSPHDLQYGVMSDEKPTVTVTGRLKRTVKSASTTVKGSAEDDQKVTDVQCSKRSATAGFKKATKFSDGKWSCKVSGLKKGKKVSLYVRAKDSADQYSAVVKVVITRAKR